MSTHITAPNYTQIPNIIFDHWMGILTPAEFKVLMCICRKTFGWQKSTDLISIKQIEKMTGLGKSGIIKNTESLIAHGLIEKIKSKTSDGDDAPNRFTVIVRIEGEGCPLSGQQVVHSVDKGVVHSVDTQKKDSTKETTTTATGDVVVVFDEEKEMKIINQLAVHLINHAQEFGKEWALSPKFLCSLAKLHGLSYLIDQVNYMIAKQQKSNRDELTSKSKKTKRIDNPLSFIRMACERNWGMSEKGTRP